MGDPIDNTSDIIDSRDVIERIEELSNAEELNDAELYELRTTPTNKRGNTMETITLPPITSGELDELASHADGGTIELAGDFSLRLKIETDDCSVRDLWSDDCYGELSKYDYDFVHEGHTPRPDHFNGRARKIEHQRGVWCWWQPPADVADTDVPALMRSVRDLLETGFLSVGLELLAGEDAYGWPIVVACAWIGGIDSLADGYLRTLLDDLAGELA